MGRRVTYARPGTGSAVAPTTKILVAEDDPSSREIMARLLERHGYEVLAVEDGPSALEVLDDGIDVALLDWMMPGMDGVELCGHIKRATNGVAYVIMVTAKAEKSEIVHALEQGADDYMTKPVDHGELMARVRAGERIAGRERELTEACDELRTEADRDALTGLYNRGYFDEALGQTLADADGVLALLMIDLDHFKRINDEHGHQVGDTVLRRVASVVSEQSRTGLDIAARYGGEELVVIAPDTTVFGARELAERIRRHVADLRIPAGGRFISVTVSVGVAVLEDPPDEAGGRAAAIIEQADTRLYQAKHTGRNRVAA